MKKRQRVNIVFAVLMVLILILPIVATPISISAADEYASRFEGGNGSQYNPFLISTKAQFNELRSFRSGAYYKLINDIVFSPSDFEAGGMYYNDGMGWLPIETPFSGSLDGNGYGVYGLQIYPSYEGGSAEVGLFAENIGTIVNLTVGFDIWVDNYTMGSDVYTAVGSICGVNDSQGKIINCKSISYTSVYGDNLTLVGGIAGINFGTISNCSNEGNVEALTDNYLATAGGIAGINYGNIIRCANKDLILGYGSFEESQVFLGGIVGGSYENSKIEKCYNLGEVYSNYDESGEYRLYGLSSCGGIVGFTYGKVLYCYNKGRIIGTSYGSGCTTGGIAGMSTEEIDQCYNDGLVTNTVTPSPNLIAGGIVGINDHGRVTNTYNRKDVGGSYIVGGIVGATYYGHISANYNMGILSPINNGTKLSVGQIVGDNTQGYVASGYYCHELQQGLYNNVIGSGTHGGGGYLSFEQMKNMSSFTYFSTTLWEVNPLAEYPYPTLKNMSNTSLATGISVTTMPNKTEYNLNEYFSKEGMKVIISYENGTSKEITDYNYLNIDTTTSGNKTVKIMYDYFSTEITVTVKNPTPVSIEIKTLPNKLNYALGSEFSDAGMWVVCTYDKGAADRITDYEVLGYDPNKLGEQTLTVVYKGLTDTFVVNVYDPENVTVTAGDVDFDLDIDSDDAIYLLYSVLFGDEAYPLNQNCNFDGQGEVDSDDAIYLLYHVLFGSAGYPLN